MIIDCHVHRYADAAFLLEQDNDQTPSDQDSDHLTYRLEGLSELEITSAVVGASPLLVPATGGRDMMESVNADVARTCEEQHGRIKLQAWAWVLPNDVDAVKLVADCWINNGRAVGFGEIAACNNQDLQEQFIGELLKWSDQLGVPVLLNEGVIRQKVSQFLWPLVKRYSQARLIITHLGRDTWRAAYLLARQNQNVYLDLAGLTPRRLESMFTSSNQFSQILGDLQDQIVFGSGFPMVSAELIIKGLTKLAPSGQIAQKIFYQNALQLFAERLSRPIQQCQWPARA